MDILLAFAISSVIYLLGSWKKRVSENPFACGERIPPERISYLTSLFSYIAILLGLESSLLLLLFFTPSRYLLIAVAIIIALVIVND